MFRKSNARTDTINPSKAGSQMTTDPPKPPTTLETTANPTAVPPPLALVRYAFDFKLAIPKVENQHHLVTRCFQV